MSRTHIALAIALAVSFGVMKPTISPVREVPLSKSVLVADNTSGQGSAKMGQGSTSSSAVNEASKSDKMTGSSSK